MVKERYAHLQRVRHAHAVDLDEHVAGERVSESPCSTNLSSGCPPLTVSYLSSQLSTIANGLDWATPCRTQQTRAGRRRRAPGAEIFRLKASSGGAIVSATRLSSSAHTIVHERTRGVSAYTGRQPGECSAAAVRERLRVFRQLHPRNSVYPRKSSSPPSPDRTTLTWRVRARERE